VLGVGLLGALALAALVGPWLARDPDRQTDPAASRLQPPLTRLWEVRLEGPRPLLLADRVRWQEDVLVLESDGRRREVPRDAVLNPTGTGVSDRRLYLLGTDALGRDVLARLLEGARISLTIAVLAAALAALLGVAVGAIAAMSRPWIDALLMRLVDALIAFPTLLLLLVLSLLFRPGVALLVLFLGATAWMGLARQMRGELVALQQRDFVLAIKALGERRLPLFLRHLLPNSLVPLLADLSLRVGAVVLVEASLSFLGLGVPAPTASWGGMIAEAQQHLATAWWLALLPGLALAATVLAFHLLADGLRDRFDPYLVDASPR
jgi:peptide/nickel transport system permease protein